MAGRINLKQFANSGASNGQVPSWVAATSQWVPTTLSGGGGYPSGVRQIAYSTTSTGVSSAATVPLDNTIPQITEGFEVLTCSITPQSATSTLFVLATLYCSNSYSGISTIIASIFRDSTANAIGTVATAIWASNTMITIPILVRTSSSSTVATTFRLRAGSNGYGTTYINGVVSLGQLFGGAAATSLMVVEVGA